jgi:hypothetical protein
MGEWLKTDSTATTKKQRNTNNDTIGMNADSELDEDTDSENEQIYEPGKNPTTERQSDSF